MNNNLSSTHESPLQTSPRGGFPTERECSIPLLLDRFFDGETSLAEEQVLYRYFASDKVAPEHRPLREMFLDLRAASPHQTSPRGGLQSSYIPLGGLRGAATRPRLWLAVAAMAACIMLLFGMKWQEDVREDRLLAQLYEGSYMIVDGQRIDDLSDIQPQIERTLALADSKERHFDEELLLQRTEEALLQACDNSEDSAYMKQIISI